MNEKINQGIEAIVAEVFPPLGFTVRGDAPGGKDMPVNARQYWMDSFNADGRVVGTRPASAQEFLLYSERDMIRRQLAALLASKAMDLEVAETRCGDYDDLLRFALFFAGDLAMMGNTVHASVKVTARLERLRELMVDWKNDHGTGHRPWQASVPGEAL